MPEEQFKTLRAAQRDRKRTAKRSEGHETVCRGRSQSTDETAVVADSIHKLKLKPKTGPEVFQALSAFGNSHIDFHVMYNDLFAAYGKARMILLNEETFDVGNAGINLALSLYHYIQEFKKLLPAEFEVDIDHDEGAKRFFFNVYRDCNWNYGWSCLEIKDTVKKLSRQSGPLHELFLSFLKSFCIATGVDFWWNNFMGATLDMLDEHIENMKGEHEDEEVMKAQRDLKNYTEGTAFSYQQTIRNSTQLKPGKILKRLEQFTTLRGAKPIVELIRLGCELMDGYSLQDFTHPQLTNDEYYLELDCQTNIIWDCSDTLSYEHEQSLDANAQEGVQMPVVLLKVDGSITTIDWAALEEKSRWPRRLNDFFANANQLIAQYTSSHKLTSILEK